MRIVVDTSILIDYLRGGAKGDSFIREIEAKKYEELFIPTIVIFELFSGKSTHNSAISEKITNLLRFFQAIELDAKIARRSGELYRDMKQTMQVPDYIIAASALELGGTVATLNTKHFEQIPGLKLYPLT